MVNSTAHPGYLEKLKDPKWQRKRLEVMQRDHWQCQRCGRTEDTLNVHHRTYLQGHDPWDYPDHLLVTLCEGCNNDEKHAWEIIGDKLNNILKTRFWGDDVGRMLWAFLQLPPRTLNDDQVDIVLFSLYLSCMSPPGVRETLKDVMKHVIEIQKDMPDQVPDAND